MVQTAMEPLPLGRMVEVSGVEGGQEITWNLTCSPGAKPLLEGHGERRLNSDLLEG